MTFEEWVQSWRDRGTLPTFKKSWDAGSNTCFLSFENDPDGVKVELKW